MKTLIIHGKIVRHDGVFAGSIAFENDRITEIGEALPIPSAKQEGLRVVDAGGCYVMPGGVDVHTHISLSTFMQDRLISVADGFLEGTRAAACGGTTCVVEHPSFSWADPQTAEEADSADAGSRLGQDFLSPCAAVRKLAQGQAMVDYGIHTVFQGNRPPFAPLQKNPSSLPLAPLVPDAATLDSLVAAALDAGYATGKVYSTYAARLHGEQCMAVLAAMGRAQALTTFHAEDHALLSWLSSRSAAAGECDPPVHPLVRPALCEQEAVARCISMARVTGAPLYIVHVSSKAALACIAKARRDMPLLFAETCPQYLLLDSSLYHEGRAEGLKYVMAPPLRQPEDCAALWEGLRTGSIDVIASDHCAFSHKSKWEMSQGNVFQCPGGVAGVQTRLPLLFSEGVLKGRLTLPRFVQLVSEAPARLMGLADKGRLEVGAHADVLVLDPHVEKVITVNTLHQHTDYTPFEGLSVRGWPRHVWVRGTAVVENGQLCATDPQGAYISRLPLCPPMV